MASVHSYPDASFKSGTGVNTTTAIYKAVYLSAENTVSICNTSTNLGAFVGILQEYANTTGVAVPVRLAGPTKAILKGASITAGNMVSIAIGSSTALGHVFPSAGKVANTAGGSLLILGNCAVGSQGGTDTVCEIVLRPFLSSALTTTISA